VSPRLASPARRAPVPRRRRAHFRFYVCLCFLPFSVLGFPRLSMESPRKRSYLNLLDYFVVSLEFVWFFC
jgi:hypothetical protein